MFKIPGSDVKRHGWKFSESESNGADADRGLRMNGMRRTGLTRSRREISETLPPYHSFNLAGKKKEAVPRMCCGALLGPGWAADSESLRSWLGPIHWQADTLQVALSKKFITASPPASQGPQRERKRDRPTWILGTRAPSSRIVRVRLGRRVPVKLPGLGPTGRTTPRAGGGGGATRHEVGPGRAGPMAPICVRRHVRPAHWTRRREAGADGPGSSLRRPRC
jgi:hypothetical protein